MPISARLLVGIQGQDYKTYNCEATLLGYKVGESVMVTISKKPAQVLLREGAKIDVRAAMQMGIAQFPSRIDRVCSAPFPYFHLAYPGVVSMETLRRYPRFPLSAEFSMIAQTSFGISTGRMPGRFVDISVNGARIALQKELSAAVLQITVSAQLVVAGTQQEMEVTATIKRAFGRDETMIDKPFVYGVSFENMPPLQTLLVLALCHELQSGASLTVG
ncbi:MAG: flagellar brake domain-containing protein [Spongiibacteraceae bacterium]